MDALLLLAAAAFGAVIALSFRAALSRSSRSERADAGRFESKGSYPAASPDMPFAGPLVRPHECVPETEVLLALENAGQTMLSFKHDIPDIASQEDGGSALGARREGLLNRLTERMLSEGMKASNFGDQVGPKKSGEGKLRNCLRTLANQNTDLSFSLAFGDDLPGGEAGLSAPEEYRAVQLLREAVVESLATHGVAAGEDIADVNVVVRIAPGELTIAVNGRGRRFSFGGHAGVTMSDLSSLQRQVL